MFHSKNNYKVIRIYSVAVQWVDKYDFIHKITNFTHEEVDKILLSIDLLR
jgi:hypothetical protein